MFRGGAAISLNSLADCRAQRAERGYRAIGILVKTCPLATLSKQ